MEDQFNYQSVPFGYSHCFNNQCPRGEKCLRHLAAVHSTDQYPSMYVVNPNRIPNDTATCPFYQSIQKIHVAWGIRSLLDNVPHKDAPSLKDHMISHFGRGMYYRFYRNERFLDPEQQEFVRRLFRQKGIKEEPVFESYSYEFKW